jgi:3-oxoacyl-[acyl-carrier-protein] synthase I
MSLIVRGGLPGRFFMSLAIQSLGTFTSVGGDVPMTMASLLTQFQAFDDLAALASDGEPLTGAATPLSPRLTGVARLGALGLLALRECAAAAQPGAPLPVLVCAPDPADLQISPGGLLELVTADAGIAVDRQQSRVFARGRIAVLEALIAARTLLTTRRATGCYLVGVDSLVMGDRPRRLVQQGRVLDGNSVDGFVPGEGAAALLLTADGKGLAVIAGLGTGAEPAGGNEELPVTGAGLHEAALRALAESGTPGTQLAAVVHDVSGVHRDFEELLLARTRPPMDVAQQAQVYAPALSVGEIGAAAGPLALAMLAFFIQQGVVDGPGLCLFRSSDQARGAAAVTPAPQRRRSAHG